MQAFCNVATLPAKHTTQRNGRIYWEFRAAESAKNEGKESATWYTVRVFQEDDPGFAKGDFVRLIGKLKLDVFMGREGKPMGVLVVMCYEAKKYEKYKSAKAMAAAPAEKAAPPAAKESRVATESEAVDDAWLAWTAQLE